MHIGFWCPNVVRAAFRNCGEPSPMTQDTDSFIRFASSESALLHSDILSKPLYKDSCSDSSVVRATGTLVSESAFVSTRTTRFPYTPL